jgi:hypothetical protein
MAYSYNVTSTQHFNTTTVDGSKYVSVLRFNYYLPYCQHTNSYFRSWQLFMCQKFPFMQHNSATPHSQKSATGSYPWPVQFNPTPFNFAPLQSISISQSYLCLGLPCGPFPWGYPTKFCICFSFSPCVFHILLITSPMIQSNLYLNNIRQIANFEAPSFLTFFRKCRI